MSFMKYEAITLSAKQSNIYVHGWQSYARHRIAVCGRRFGKALSLDTRIPTPNGWTTMGELSEGDAVFDERGNPCKVIMATDVMHGRPCFRVLFSDGSAIIADHEHQWLTWDRCARKNAARNSKKLNAGTRKPITNDKPCVRTTAEIADTLTSGSRGDNNHSIQPCEPVNYPTKDFIVPPYILGAWLGDGIGVHAVLATNDQQIVDEIRKEGQAIYKMPEPFLWRMSNGNKANSLQAKLRQIGVIGNKHVPVQYLQGDVSQRLALLQGMMDIDGTVSVGGHCDFTNTNKALCDAVLEITRSLGIRSVMSEGRATLYGVDCGPKWRVTFTTSLPVFRLQRKLDRLNARKSGRNIDHRMIVAVEPVDSVPVRCIMVDSPNSLYLAGEAFIVTHNTFLIRREIKRAAQLAAKWRVPIQNEIWYGAPTFKQAKRVFWRLMKRSIPPSWIDGKPNESECSITLKSGHIMRIVGLDNYDDLRGSGLFFFVGDEWADANPLCWTEVIRPMLATAKGHSLKIGTGKGFNHFHGDWVKGQPGAVDSEGNPITDHKSWSYTTKDGGNVPDDELASAKRDLDPRTYRQEYEATWESYAGQVVYAFKRTKHVRSCPYNSKLPLHIGMDFNVNPMSAAVWQELGGASAEARDLGIKLLTAGETISVQVGEIIIPTSDTVEMCEEIVRRYGNPNGHNSHITVYPDPAGAQRRTSAQGKTDISILSDPRYGFKVKALKSHPLVRDRNNVLNSRFENANGEHRAFVDPSCVKCIEAYERLEYKEGTSEPDKRSGYDHPVDASGYYTFAQFDKTQKIEFINLFHMER